MTFHTASTAELEIELAHCEESAETGSHHAATTVEVILTELGRRTVADMRGKGLTVPIRFR